MIPEIIDAVNTNALRFVEQTIVCGVDMVGRAAPNMTMSIDARYRTFGEGVRLRRMKLKMTQADLAAKVGLSRASIANIEQGRQSVLLHNACDMAGALELQLMDLLPATAASSLEDQALALSDAVSPRAKIQINDLIAHALASARSRP